MRYIDSEKKNKKNCIPRKFSLNLQHALNDRESGFIRRNWRSKALTWHYTHEREFYRSLRPNFTVKNIKKPDYYLRKFTPDGNYLLGFNEDQNSIVLYAYKGVAKAYTLLNKIKHEFIEDNNKRCKFIQANLFNTLFKFHVEIPVNLPPRHGRLLCNFAIFMDNGHYVLVGSSTAAQEPLSPSAYLDYPDMNSESDICDASLYLVDLKKYEVSDVYELRNDSVHFVTNHGISVYENKIVVMSLLRQALVILQVEKGKFKYLYEIGPYSDQVSSHAVQLLMRADGTLTTPSLIVPYTHLKQKIITHLYCKARKGTKEGLTERLKDFFEIFPKYERMLLSAVQFIDKTSLLLRYRLAENCVLFVYYSLLKQKVLLTFFHNSVELLDFMRQHLDKFIKTYGASELPISNRDSDFLLKHVLLKASDSLTDVPQLMNAGLLPITLQNFSSSPYFDYSNFIYTDCLEPIMEMAAAEKPKCFQFFDRHLQTLSFNMHLTYPHFGFIFHPYEPFAISLQKTAECKFSVYLHNPKSVLNKNCIKKRDLDELKMEYEEFIIEEVDSIDLPESELAQFEETKPLEVIAVLDDDKEAKEDSALIKKFVSGELDLPDLYPKLDPSDDEDQEFIDISDGESSQQRHASFSSVVDTTVDEYDEQPSGSRAKHQRRSCGTSYYSRRGVLDAGLKGLMGEANLCFAQGQMEKAERICMEIIRQNPLAAEPFLTLAQIYENRDHEKYIGFFTIAAHLMPHKREHWIHVANLHIASNNLSKARTFYSKAIKMNPKCYDLRMRKAQLLERMGENYLAMLTYLHMLPLMPEEEGEHCLEIAKKVARHFHDIGKHSFAMQAIDAAYNVCPQLFTLEDINLYLELAILNKSYAKVILLLKDRTHMQIDCEFINDELVIHNCIIPQDFVPDIRAKLIVSLINLHAYHLIDYLIADAHEHMLVTHESALDLYVDVAEALMHCEKYAEAITLLTPITEGLTNIECPAFIWLSFAECFRHLKRTNDAIDSYYRVVELAPNCFEAKFTLAALLKQEGRHKEAIDALEQATDTGEPLNARMLYERCLMLRDMQRMEEYLETGYVLLSRHSIKLRNRDEVLAVANTGNCFNSDAIKVVLEMRSIAEPTDEAALQEFSKREDAEVSTQMEYDLFTQLIEVAFKFRKFSFIERVLFGMVTTKRFTRFQQSLERIFILAAYFNDDCQVAFSHLREKISRHHINLSYWNMMTLLVQKSQDLRYHRFIRRLIQRVDCAPQIRLFIAHYHLHCNSYKYAFQYYIPIYKEQEEPIAALCIAVVFNQLSMQKKILRKTAAVGQAIAFAEAYAQLRCTGNAWENAQEIVLPVHQEIYYNIGRIYQQAGVNHLAVHYYERALAVEHKLLSRYEEHLGLKQEIAFNLHLIYRASGNFHKARHYLYTYCVI